MLYDEQGIDAISKLPSKQEMYGMIAGTVGDGACFSVADAVP